MNSYKTIIAGCLLASMTIYGSVSAAVPESISRHYQQPISESAQFNIKAPDIAENGAVVPVTVEFAESGSQRIREVAVYNAKRAEQAITIYKMNPEVNLARLGTRIKLGESTNIYAVARMDDGKLVAASKQIKVTIGGCGGP